MGNHKFKKIDSGDEDDRELTHCGYFSWRPSFLQCFNSPILFVLVFGITNLFSVMSVGVISLVIPTLEKLFNLNSKQTGFILMANDLSGVVCAVLLSNYCSSRKTRWIGIGMLIMVLSALLPASSQLFVELPQPVNMTRAGEGGMPGGPGFGFQAPSEAIMCSSNKSFNSMDNLNGGTQEAKKLYAVNNNRLYWMHVVGALIQGIGSTPPGIAGATYMDEIFTQKQFSLAISVLYVISFIGFPLSYIIGAKFLANYVTLNPPEGMTFMSPGWVGAWWIGYVFPALIVLIFTPVIMLFPRQMPAAKRVLQSKIGKGITTATEKANELNRSLKEITKDMIPALKRLVKNKSLDFLLIGDCFLFIHVGGFAFFPKLYSMMFKIDPREVGYLLGFVNIVAFTIGLGIGGFIMYKKDFNGKQSALIMAIFSVIGIPFVLAMLIYCPLDTHVGIDAPYISLFANDNQNNIITGLDNACNSDCMCDTAFYTPICANGSTYFSPCYAGCQGEENTTLNGVPSKLYTECSCIPGGFATPGVCGDQCTDRLYISLGLSLLGTVLGFISFPAHAIVYLRVVSEVDRTLAQGMRQTLTRALGTLPAPLLFGYILDRYCTIWRTTDGVSGNCWLYDIEGLIMFIVVVNLMIKVISSSCYFLCWWFYPDTSEEAAAKVEEYELGLQESNNSYSHKIELFNNYEGNNML